MFEGFQVFDVRVRHSDLDVFDVWSDADDGIKQRLLKPECGDDHATRFRAEVVQLRQFQQDFIFSLQLKNNVINLLQGFFPLRQSTLKILSIENIENFK